jgi:hypothetical protein
VATGTRDYGGGTFHQRFHIERFIDGPHIAEAEMLIDLHLVARLAAKQPPDRLTEPLSHYVPECDFNARYRRYADHAQVPERLLLQDTHDLLDVARIAADDERG